jgi:MFS transporter, ACS family, glucarate transporter
MENDLTANAEVGSVKTSDKSAKYGYALIALLFLGWMLGGFDRTVINFSVIYIAKDFGINATQQGLVLSSFFAGYLIMQIPGGMLADKFGARKVLLGVVFVWSVFTGLTGAVSSLTAMLLVRFFFGLGEGPYTPSAGKMIAQTFVPEKRGKATSLVLCSSGFVNILAPVITGYALVAASWRNLFFVIGGVGVIVIILFYLFFKNPAETKPAAAEDAVRQKTPYRKLFSSPMMLGLLIANFAAYTVSWGLSSWMPSYLMKSFHIDLTATGWLQSIPGLASFLSILASGFIIDRLSDRQNKISVSVMAFAGAICLFVMYLGVMNVAVIILLETVVSFVLGYIVIYLPALVYKKFPPEIVGSASGTTNCAAQIGGFCAPVLMGVITDASGGNIGASFWYLFAMGVILLGAVAFMKLSVSKAAAQD